MKKNTLIIVLAIVSSIALVYAFIKADESNKARIEAEKQRQEAEKLKEELIEFRRTVEEITEEARRQQAEAERIMVLYQECIQGK